MFWNKSQKLQLPYDVRTHARTHNTNTNMIYSDIQTTADAVNKMKSHSQFLPFGTFLNCGFNSCRAVRFYPSFCAQNDLLLAAKKRLTLHSFPELCVHSWTQSGTPKNIHPRTYSQLSQSFYMKIKIFDRLTTDPLCWFSVTGCLVILYPFFRVMVYLFHVQ